MRKSMMMKQTGVWLAAAVMAAALTGCSRNRGAEPGAESSAGAEFSAAAESSPAVVKVVSSRGEVELPVNPERVAVFDMGILDSLDYLGVEAEYAVPTANLTDRLSKYKNAANAGGIKEPDLEAVFEFEPDLIIISGRQEAFYEELEKIAPTWYASLDYTRLMEDFTDIYRTMGQVFDKEKEAEDAVRTIEARIEEVAEKAGSMEEKGLVLLTNDGSVSAYGSGSRFGLIHDILGVKAADPGIESSTHGQSVGYEYIAKVNPDILFVVDRGAVVAGRGDSGGTLDNELVESTNAYKHGRVVTLDAENWYLAGIGLRSFQEMIGEVERALE